MRKKTVFLIVGCLAIVAFVLIALQFEKPKPIDMRGLAPEISEETPMTPKGFTLKSRNGESVSLETFKGKPILLNFWATWCPPCVEELPQLLAFAVWAKKETGMTVLAVSEDESWDVIDKFIREKKMGPIDSLPIKILLDSSNTVAVSYGTVKYPETYFIGKDFKAIRKFVGSMPWMSQEIQSWIKEHSH